MFTRILTVCTGNICRSPAAQFLLRQRIEKAGRRVEARSAGTGALVNHPAEEATSAMLGARGIDLSSHRASQLTPERLRWAELVLVMEKHHRDAVVTMDPTARGKTFLLGHWTKTEIPDPYLRDDAAHAKALDLIEEAIEPWVSKLR
ncbi:low molecular weight protein-tyrosine-phosphatase [Accumulibacter sp.]|uniref:low molecular weight protein-tyrosine-phosphatase n=1 Tax=Accumulibacter sp. TaxID=2053492 RepID=UPI0025E46633|nr:low molecular weight protein-tyrosine-phosphatase [Accumulibacter sp.]MCM8594281.1 low molecular weight phosphotyrosine protein phosphatase [Accumulibacter sp.]MCM8627896.1 low molecular weight phosphotyrosine protein phosphatase [Accumulibacter sp.]MDS4048425.1 low molecular weight protein-tyrosine-phosphatase [Accumulibacter sp.]